MIGSGSAIVMRIRPDPDPLRLFQVLFLSKGFWDKASLHYIGFFKAPICKCL